MAEFWTVVLCVIGWAVSVYRDEIKDFLGLRWRSFRKSVTEDLKLITRRSLGPYSEKHDVPDPFHRQNIKLLLMFAVAYPLLLTPYGGTRWLGVAIVYVGISRFFLVSVFLSIYRAKLLPRVFTQGRQLRNRSTII